MLTLRTVLGLCFGFIIFRPKKSENNGHLAVNQSNKRCFYPWPPAICIAESAPCILETLWLQLRNPTYNSTHSTSGSPMPTPSLKLNYLTLIPTLTLLPLKILFDTSYNLNQLPSDWKTGYKQQFLRKVTNVIHLIIDP